MSGDSSLITPAMMQKIALALAVFTSLISLGLAVFAGLHRAGTIAEQVWSVALSVTMVLISHLSPLFWRMLPRQSRIARVALLALWFVALSMVLRGQADVLGFAHKHAADQRAQAVSVDALRSVSTVPTGRSLTAITQEITDAATDLFGAESRRCWGECRGLRARKAMLAARFDALNTEASEAKRRETEEDRLRLQISRAQELRESRRADPVTSLVAQSLGTTEARLDTLLDLAGEVVLEGTACFAWYLAGIRLVAGGRIRERYDCTSAWSGRADPERDVRYSG